MTLLSSLEVKKAARVVFEKFKNQQRMPQRESHPYLGEPREFLPQLDLQVAEEAFHVLALRNLIMRASDYTTKYQLTSFGKSIDVADVFEKTIDFAMISQLSEMLDPELSQQCFGKSYEDAITSAFRVLEERLRQRINAAAELFGLELVDAVFNPQKGKLTFGETDGERQALYQIYRSAFLMLRNPPSHRYLEEFQGAEIVEIVMFVDFLLKILRKAAYHGFPA